MNRVLKRQIKNSFGKDFDITTLDPKIQEFIQNVEESYDEFEKEKKFLENVVDVNSTELYEANKQIIQQNKNLNELLEKNEKLLENRIEENLEIETTLKQYKQAMDTALLVSTFDYEGKITFVNSNFCALTGYSKTEVLDKKYNFLHYEESSHLDEEIFEAIRNKKIWTGVLKYKNRDLKIYDLNTTIFPILNAQNEILEYMSIFQDITEIENSRQKALDLDRAKSLFIANMSHELRTPLNGILGFSQLLRRQKDISEKIKTYVDKINSSGEHLLKLINSILDFSKIESGEIVLEHLEINLYNLIGAALVQQENTAKLKNISLHIDYDSSLGKEFFGDSLRLSQVLTNLISNALKFTDTGEIRVGVKKIDTNRIQIAVKDTGIGLDANEQEKLFKEFSQADNSTTRKYGGTGLGLSISKKLIELMHGKIWIESIKGEGSSFIFEIDLEEKV